MVWSFNINSLPLLIPLMCFELRGVHSPPGGDLDAEDDIGVFRHVVVPLLLVVVIEGFVDPGALLVGLLAELLRVLALGLQLLVLLLVGDPTVLAVTEVHAVSGGVALGGVGVGHDITFLFGSVSQITCALTGT